MLEIKYKGKEGVFFTTDEYEYLKVLVQTLRNDIVTLQKEMNTNE